MSHPKSEHVAWSKKLFKSLNDGGVWVVPRSGLTFRRDGGDMHLVSRASLKEYVDLAGGAGWTAGQGAAEVVRWQSFQQEDFRLISRHFESAGIQVFDTTDPGESPSC